MTKSDSVVLPKQWKHWLVKNGLRQTYHSKRGTNLLYYFNDKEFRFMAGTGQTLTVASYKNFDRWAISRLSDIEYPIPKNLREFTETIAKMRNEAKNHPRHVST